jgi:hypothetical protein
MGMVAMREDLFSFATELPDEYYVIAAHLMTYNTAAW